MRIFLVEDSSLVVVRLTGLLGALPNARVVGHANRADEAVRAILAVAPDVVLVDLKLAQGTGFDVLIEMHEKAPEIACYMLSNNSSAPYRRQAEQLGARGFFDKSSEIGKLREVLAARAADGVGIVLAPPAALS